MGFRIVFCAQLFSLLTLCCGVSSADELEQFQKDLNADVIDLVPTADIEVYRVADTRMEWKLIIESLKFAKEAFGKAGLQLRITKMTEIMNPAPALKELSGIYPTGQQKNFVELPDSYKNIESKVYEIEKGSVELLKKVIRPGDNPSRTLRFLALNNTSYSFYNKKSDNEWELRTIGTAGFSFPSYMLRNRLPDFIRGLVTVSSSGKSTLAHELGHKLMNVTHEGWHACPKFSGSKVPGLMGYSGESAIGEGLEGRWHKERLLLSPFVYIKSSDGKKKWNEDYRNGGAYDDPIYGGYIVDPVCSI